MALEQRTGPWHENEDCGVAMLSAVPEWREYVRQVRTIDFLLAYNDVYASTIGCSVCFAWGGCDYSSIYHMVMETIV